MTNTNSSTTSGPSAETEVPVETEGQSTVGAEGGAGAGGERGGLAQRLREFSRIQVVLLALCGVLLAAAAVFFVQAGAQGDGAENQALVDQARGDAVATAVSRGLTQVLSYDHRQPEATKAFASQVLDGQAREQYDTLFQSLQERAPGQKLVLSTVVQASAVQELTADKAKLLVFLDQMSTRAGDKESSVSAAQLNVVAERRGKNWVITGLSPL